MSAEFRRRSLIFLSCCALLIGAVVAWSAATSKPAPSPYDDEEYQEIAASQLGSIYDLEAWASAVQADFVPILPPVPELTLRQSGSPVVLPFSTRNFPPEFTRRLSGIYENTVPVYPILVVEDPGTRALTFYNADNEAVYTLPAPQGYDPFAYLRGLMPALYNGGANAAARQYWQSLYDPARVRVEARLIESDNLAHWIYAKRQIEEAAALQVDDDGGFSAMMMQGEVTNTNILFTAVKRTNSNISITLKYPSGFTNGLDIFTCNELVPEIWNFAAKNLATTGTNLTWLDTNAWVAVGIPTRLYAAADATTDVDGDGYTDGREIMVYGTDPNSSNSHPVSVSGTLSYGGTETGTFYVVFATETDNWSLAKSMALPSTGSYSNNEIGNGTSHWFKAFRDANGNFMLDGWEPRGLYSNTSVLVTGSLAGIDITVRDVPSIWGQISYSGTATGDIHVIATTGSNGWDATYHAVIPWVQSEGMSGEQYYVSFPVNFALTGMPASNYWIRAYMDTDTNGTPSGLDVAGQYSTNALAVSNRVTGINLTMTYDYDSDGLADWWELMHFGTLALGPDDDPDSDTLDNLTESQLGTAPGAANTVQSVGGGDVALETRMVASKRTLPKEGVEGFQQNGTYYRDISLSAAASWYAYDCMSATTSVGQITAQVNTHFVIETNCNSVWSSSGSLSAHNTDTPDDTNAPSSSKRNDWVWSNRDVWYSPGTPWQQSVAGTTVFFACTGTTNPSSCSSATTNAPCEPPLVLLTGTGTMATNTVSDTLQQWRWDGDYTPGCTGEVIRSSQAAGPLAITLSTPITITTLIAEVLADIQDTNNWQGLDFVTNAEPRWVHQCPDQTLGCDPEADSIAAFYTNSLSAGAKRGQYRISVPNSVSGVVYRAAVLKQRMSDGTTIDITPHHVIGDGTTVYMTSSNGVDVSPPSTVDCVRISLIALSAITNLWWFNGEDPGSGYEIQTTLVATPVTVGTFQWDVTVGASIVNLQNGGADMDSITATNDNDITVKSTTNSTSPNDVTILLTYNGTVVCDCSFTVRKPGPPESLSGFPADVAWGSGFQTTYRYKMRDQFGADVPFDMPVNESFGTWTSDWWLEVWPEPTPNGMNTFTYSGVDHTFADEYGLILGFPLPVNPTDSDATNAVQHATQYYRAGSLTPGAGVLIKQHTLQFMRGMARQL